VYNGFRAMGFRGAAEGTADRAGGIRSEEGLEGRKRLRVFSTRGISGGRLRRGPQLMGREVFSCLFVDFIENV
jgi:hypothetical protein